MTINETTKQGATVLLSTLHKHAVIDAKNESLGKIADVIVMLRGDDYPLVTGLVAKVGGNTVYVAMSRVTDLDANRVELKSAKLDLRPFARRNGEVLLREDVLGHRLIDIDRAILVRAHDVQLTETAEGWVASALDVHKRRLLGLGSNHAHHALRDWQGFEALIGHEDSVLVRSPFGHLRRLKPAQIADLIEDASRPERDELLNQVQADPELEADVFEELDEDQQSQLLRTRPIASVAELIGRMRADDAADAIMDLPQDMRQPVLDSLPAQQGVKVRTLLGYNDASAGGLMGTDYLSAGEDETVAAAIDKVRSATTSQPEALTTIYALNAAGQLTGVISLVRALQSDPAAMLRDVVDSDPVCANPDDDLVELARRMNDFNLLTLPVVDQDNRVLGVITVDDMLEAATPPDWRKREVRRHAARARLSELDD